MRILNKFNFIIGLIAVIITFFPGLLIGDGVTIVLKAVGMLGYFMIGYVEMVTGSPQLWMHIIRDVIIEAFILTAFGKMAGMFVVIILPIFLFKSFTKLKVNWLPAIILLIPALIYIGGVRQVQKYAELYDGLYFLSSSAGFIVGTFFPLFFAYLYAKGKF